MSTTNHVLTKCGYVKGRILKNHFGAPISAFQGVPYAQPPVGKLRFKAPQPITPWKDTLEAVKNPPSCYQRNYISQKIIGKDNCLYLNIFTPDVPENKGQHLRPVLVFIHGGLFLDGSCSSEFFGPEFLLTEDIVLVVINYRLNLFGFLCFEDEQFGIPGNAGLKDQVLALKWIKDNIESFGGNPENITIAGESAGGACVHFHMLAKQSKGLFQKAILQSGCALHKWTHGGRNSGPILAKLLGIQDKSPSEILNYIQTMPLDDEVVRYQDKVIGELQKNGLYLGPVLEPYSTENTFLDKNPRDIVKFRDYNKVPFIIGYTSNEYLYSEVVRNLRNRPVNCLPIKNVIPNYIRALKNSDTLTEKIKEYYFGGHENTLTNSKEHINFQSDNMILWDTYKCIKMHKENNDTVYMYRFSAESQLNVFKNLSPVTSKMPGTCHIDDLGYLFKTIFTPPIKKDSLEEKLMRSVVKMWTNFAKDGNPTPNDEIASWTPVQNIDKINFLEIGNVIQPGDQLPEIERLKFGEAVIPE